MFRCLALGLWLVLPAARAAEPLRLFAAASLAPALEPLAADYLAATGQRLLPVYGASSALARQIDRGAPADAFISANPRWMQTLIDSGVVDASQVRALLGNELVFAAPSNSPLNAIDTAPSEAQLNAWLDGGRLALGDPQHVPIGIYAERALRHASLWQNTQHKLAPTEDARATLALLQRGEVPLAVIYRSDLSSTPSLKAVAPLPLPSGEKINYPLAPVSDIAEPLLRYLRSDAARTTFIDAGFTVLN